MVKKIVLGFGIVALLASCECKQDCPQNTPDNVQAPKDSVVAFSSLSGLSQKIIGGEVGVLRGVDMWTQFSELKEDTADLTSNLSEIGNYSFMSDVSEYDFIETEYQYDEGKLSNIQIEAFFGFDEDLWVSYFDFIKYFDSKYGEHRKGLKQEKYWNDSLPGDKDLIIKLEYKFPEKEYDVVVGDDGQPDTVKNNAYVTLTAKSI